MATRVQEQARKARYALMAGYMAERGIQRLFLAHHTDDQAETLLFRLAKGSGLDGLAGMAPVQNFRTEAGKEIILCRPFLEDFGKADLIRTCVDNVIPFVDDPSNEAVRFARARLRRSYDVLAEEGLTKARILRLAQRLARARNALGEISAKAYSEAVLEKNTKQIVLRKNVVFLQPEEIVLRVILLAMEELQRCSVPGGRGDTYGPRLARVEKLCIDLLRPGRFRTRTLGGIKFERRDEKGKEAVLILTLEHQ